MQKLSDREFVVEYWRWNHMSNTMAAEADIVRYYRRDWQMSESSAWRFMRMAIVENDVVFRNWWMQMHPPVNVR